MSSVARTYANNINSNLNTIVIGPSYIFSGVGRLFPFTYANGVLDIVFTGTGFKTSMVDTPTFPGINDPSTNQYPVRILGGTNLVQNIGPNFTTYISALFTSGSFTSATNIRVYIPGVVTKVQLLDIVTLGTTDDQYAVSTSPPNNDYNTSILPNYNTTYVFKHPLTIAVMTNLGQRYFTLKSDIYQST